MIPIIDTQKAIKSLTKGRVFTQKQAESLVETVGQAHEQLATKGDIATVKTDISLVRKDMEVIETKLSSDIREVRNEMEMIETRLSGSIERVRKERQASDAVSDANFAKMQRSFTLQIFGAIGLLFMALQFFER